MFEKKIEKRKFCIGKNLLSALKQMDKINKKLLFVFDGSKFLNIISIGDIQRAILKNISLDSPIKNVLRKNTLVAKHTDSIESIKNKMKEHRIEFMPILNEKKKLVNVFFWNDIFDENEKISNTKFNLPVVIMSGGKGTRLKPLTNVIPKPLIPVGNHTIIEEIMNRFVNVGCNNFYLSVNYKAATIMHYFEELKNKSYHVSYFQEDKPLGTAGSLYLIKDKIKSSFFVSNCDIIIDADYSDILKYHQDNKNELTIISALRHYPIPYGTIETRNGGVLSKLTEKPELTFQINSGMYILEHHLLNEIPHNEFFHITHLIDKIKKRKGKIGVYPVSEGSWTDIGDRNEYLNLLRKF